MYPQLFRRFLFPAYERAIGRNTHVYLREYENSQRLPRPALDALQLAKLNRLLDHCWRNVPFLEHHWRSAGLVPRALRSVIELQRFPRLTKSLVTANYQDCIATNWRGRTMTKSTGGSSGQPFRFEYTMDSYARRTALMWRGYAWGGAALGTRAAYLWGANAPRQGWAKLKDSWYHRAFNRRYFSAFAMRQETIGDYVREIRAYRPEVVVGYVSPLLLVARWLNARGERVAGLRGVITGAEPLFEPERAEIQQAFGAPVTNTYGSRETMLMASECERHTGLHVHMDHLVLETVDRNDRQMSGVSGEVLVTDLHNFGMPLVRYANGDRATYSEATCACGREMPLLSRIDGRLLETIIAPNGRILPGELFVHAMLEWSCVRQYLFVQTSSDAIEVQLVADPPLNPEQCERLRAQLTKTMGESMRIELRPVTAIAPLASGKRRVTVALAT